MYDESVLLVVFMKMVVFKNPPSYIPQKKAATFLFWQEGNLYFFCEFDFGQFCAIISINGFNYFKT
jgi:hypothetical protein